MRNSKTLLKQLTDLEQRVQYRVTAYEFVVYYNDNDAINLQAKALTNPSIVYVAFDLRGVCNG